MSATDEIFGDSQAAEATAPASAPAADASSAPAPQPGEPSAAQPTDSAASPAAPEGANSPSNPAHVPLDVLLRTREEMGGRVSQAEARAAAAERQLAEIRRKEREAADKAKQQRPDVFADPDGYHAHMERLTEERIAATRAELQAERQAERIADSEEKWAEKLGGEQSEDWKSLNAWLGKLPDNAVAHFEQQRDPYGAAWKQFAKLREDDEARKLRSQLNGKTLDELIAEGVAAKMAEQASATPSEPARRDQPRDPSGKFSSPGNSQPHRPVSLADVSAAANAVNGRGGEGDYFQDEFRT